MTDKLKPCPFCGNKYPSFVPNRFRDIFVMRCGVCGVETRKYRSAEEAHTAWDKRQGEEVLLEKLNRLAALEAAIADIFGDDGAKNLERINKGTLPGFAVISAQSLQKLKAVLEEK